MIAVSSTGWKLPFNLAVLLHVVLLSSAIVLPKYINKKPIIPDAYTVDLVSIAQPMSAPPAAPTPKQVEPTVKIQKLKAVEASKTAHMAQPIAQPDPVEPAQAISLKPLKRKIKNINAPKLHSQQNRKKQQAIEAQRQKHLQEARRQQALAAEEAQIAASNAVNALKQMLRTDAAIGSTTTGQGSAARRTGGTSSALESQYYASIFAHLHQYWALPDVKPWDPELNAVVIIVISKNGHIVRHNFEKRSGDRVFDQFVSRTIQEANPLPAIPAALKKNQYTLGLRFKPDAIQ